MTHARGLRFRRWWRLTIVAALAALAGWAVPQASLANENPGGCGGVVQNPHPSSGLAKKYVITKLGVTCGPNVTAMQETVHLWYCPTNRPAGGPTNWGSEGCSAIYAGVRQVAPVAAGITYIVYAPEEGKEGFQGSGWYVAAGNWIWSTGGATLTGSGTSAPQRCTYDISTDTMACGAF